MDNPLNEITGMPQDQKTDSAECAFVRTIEQIIGKMSSNWVLWAVLGSVIASLIFRRPRKKTATDFFGEWVPTILLLGAYNKITRAFRHA